MTENHTADPLRVSIRLSSDLATSELTEVIALADEEAAARCWFASNPYEKSALVTAAAATQIVRRAAIGVGTVNVRLYEPYLLAENVTTLAHLSRGGFALGLGVGLDDQRSRLGLPARSGLKLMRTTVSQVRALCAGEAVTFSEEAESPAVTLAIEPVEVPILVGAVGPRFLSLAGEIADGVIFSMGCGTPYLVEAIARCQQAEPETPRHAFQRVAYVIYGGEIDRPTASARLKPVVGHLASYLDSSHPALDPLSDSPAIARRLRDGKPAEEAVPDELMDDVTIWGNIDRCLDRLAHYRALGVTEVALGLGRWLPDLPAALRDFGRLQRAWTGPES